MTALRISTATYVSLSGNPTPDSVVDRRSSIFLRACYTTSSEGANGQLILVKVQELANLPVTGAAQLTRT